MLEKRPQGLLFLKYVVTTIKTTFSKNSWHSSKFCTVSWAFSKNENKANQFLAIDERLLHAQVNERKRSPLSNKDMSRVSVADKSYETTNQQTSGATAVYLSKGYPTSHTNHENGRSGMDGVYYGPEVLKLSNPLTNKLQLTSLPTR